MRDLYEVLGVPRDAIPETIKAAYRKASKAAHPDAGGTPEQFAELRTAYEALSDPETRARYDETGTFDPRKVDTLDQEATGCLAGLLRQIIADDSGDPVQFDLVAKMTECLNTSRDKLVEQMMDVEHRIERANKMHGRFTLKAREPGPDPIRGALTWFIEQQKPRLEALQRGIEVHQRALEMVEKYDFEADASGWGTITATTAGGYSVAMRWNTEQMREKHKSQFGF